MKYLMMMMSLLLISGCSQPDQETENQSGMTIITTVGMIGDIVRQVAGEEAEVLDLIGSGVDPHLYKPTRSDVARLMEADMIFYVGLKLEGKMEDVLERFKEKNPHVYAVTRLIDEEYLLYPEGTSGYADPHVWMDVSAWKQAVKIVVEALSNYAPDKAAEFTVRGDQLFEEMGRLHAYVGDVVASIPEDQRILVTAHDAFNYFGRAYNIEVMGIQGLSTESEAGLDDINRLVDLLVERNIGAVFVESSVADKNVMALIEGAASRGHKVRIGGSLYSDAMGVKGTYTGTYIGMLDHNATTIAKALKGDVPDGGFKDRLGELK